EFDQAKAFVERELTYLRQHGHALPERIDVGTMVEVPALLYQLNELLKKVDFVSVGSNDLFQFLFAVDRGNAKVSERFDTMSAPIMRALRDIVCKAQAAKKSASLCGEMASKPISALALIALELAELNPLIDAVKTYRAIVKELADTEALIADPASDLEMRGMAEAEREMLQARRAELEQKIRVALLPKDAMDDRNVMLEIRAGTGGDEAALFAGDLFRMYERFAALQGWQVDVISASEGTMGGLKEIIAEVKDRGALATLQFEHGLHRVPR